jgi:hypothetical protein
MKTTSPPSGDVGTPVKPGAAGNQPINRHNLLLGCKRKTKTFISAGSCAFIVCSAFCPSIIFVKMHCVFSVFFGLLFTGKEAVFAVNWFSRGWLKRNGTDFAATGTFGFKQFFLCYTIHLAAY